MKLTAKLAACVALGGLALAGAVAPAAAASPATAAFLANVRPNVSFLDASSRLALDKSQNRAVRAFAYAEAKQQTIAGNSLVAYVQTNTVRGEAVALGVPVSPLAPVVDLATVPLDVAAATTTDIGDVVTGRSVAIGAPIIATPLPRTVGGSLLPAEQDDMNRLNATSGRGFDSLYKSTQLDGLRQLQTLYGDYAANGDDPTLRAMAARELPQVNRRIAQLRRL